MKRIIIIALSLAIYQVSRADGLLAMVNPVERTMPSGSRDISFNTQYFEATDYTSVRHFTDDWRGSYTPRNDKNLAIYFARADVSVLQENWSLGYFIRQDILLESNREMTDIAHANKIGTPVPTGNVYNPRLAMNGFAAYGIRFDKGFSWQVASNFKESFGVGISLLKGQRTRFGQVQGTALSTTTGYTYDVNLSDADSRKSYPFMPEGDISSIGYALDLGWKFHWQDGRCIDLALNDLFGQIQWKNLPLTKMTANSATATYDAQGYIIFNPTVSGQNSRVDITQKMDVKGSIQFHSPLTQRLSANLATEWIKDNIFPRLGMEYLTENEIYLQTDYDIRFKTYGVGANWRKVYLTARTESLNFDQSRGYGIETGLTFPF